MFRKQFVHLLTLLGAGGLSTVSAIDAGNSRIQRYRVKGFSCATCAVGLDTTPQKRPGVVWSHANYAEDSVAIKFDPREVSELSLRDFIEGTGFSVEERHSS